MASPTNAAVEAPLPEAGRSPAAEQRQDTLLKALSHPELGDIRIDEELIAIGRNEPPFSSYPADTVAELSRRHARIFSEYGELYIADLGSKNGSTVNGADIRQRICRLQQGDVVGFGKTLSYRVQLGARSHRPAPAAKLAALTLTPEHGELGLHQIVVTQFPFLISKSGDAFARYREAHPHQVNYLSRRHAHIFLKQGAPFLEDLGSTNGSYVNGRRLDEHAYPLKEGDEIAFGGHHFVYRVGLQAEQPETELTMTRFSPSSLPPSREDAVQPVADGAEPDGDKTTFVGAAGSFLDIFCVDQASPQDEQALAEPADKAADEGRPAGRRRGKWALFLSELKTAFSGGEGKGKARLWPWVAVAGVVLAIAAIAIYRSGAEEREMKDLLEKGQFAQAAALADDYLARSPENAEVKALGTEALLKAHVPDWLAALKERRFDRAAAILADLKKSGSHNADVAAMAAELEWMGRLQQFTASRRSPTAPINIFSDEESLNALLQRWNEDTAGHQRSFAKIASYVPEFKEPYAEALSQLRRLQSDDTVYLAAIARLKAAIETELNRGQPEALEGVFNEYAEKYPRIGGIDSLRSDLRRYVAIDSALRNDNAADLVAALANAQFATPPFQARFRALAESGRLPPPDVVSQYQAVAKAWHAGDTRQALAELQKMAAGPAAPMAARQLERKSAIAERYASLQQARGSPGYAERLLSFYGVLDPEEDAYFIQAVAADLQQNQDKALQRAQELFRQTQAQWQRYVENGGMAAGQRLEPQISPQFRAQAQLLSAADSAARQGLRLYTQLKVEPPAEWRKLQEEVRAELEQQRKSLQELRTVLDAKLLKSKLALLGGSGS